MTYPRAEIEATVERFIEAFREAERRGTWSWLADRFYHEDCVYDCAYAGAMPIIANGREEIRRTHYGRDMEVGSGWAGWSFPIVDYAVNGDEIITHWLNRGPGLRGDGTYFETHGVSFITYGGDGKFIRQSDLFDLAHQMRLCDELEEAGLLPLRLNAEWVVPMKAKLIAMLG